MKWRNTMLECREYSYQELCSIFNTRDARSIKNRLTRWKVEYTYEGRGANLKLTIQNIRDPFRVFCILELSYAPNTDFRKLAYFLYYYMNDIEFYGLPCTRQEQKIRMDGRLPGRPWNPIFGVWQIMNLSCALLEISDIILRWAKPSLIRTKKPISRHGMNTGYTEKLCRRKMRFGRCAESMAAWQENRQSRSRTFFISTHGIRWTLTQPQEWKRIWTNLYHPIIPKRRNL